MFDCLRVDSPPLLLSSPSTPQQPLLFSQPCSSISTRDEVWWSSGTDGRTDQTQRAQEVKKAGQEKGSSWACGGILSIQSSEQIWGPGEYPGSQHPGGIAKEGAPQQGTEARSDYIWSYRKTRCLSAWAWMQKEGKYGPQWNPLEDSEKSFNILSAVRQAKSGLLVSGLWVTLM